MNEKYGGSYDRVESYCKRHADQQLGIQQPSYKTSLPAPAYRQPLFIKPSFQQQHALPQEAQHLTLPQPLQYPALPQPQQVLDPSPQYQALPQPQRVLAPSQLRQAPQFYALPQPIQQHALAQQPLGIAYNQRGGKRKNNEIREEDRKRIILENNVKQIKRKRMGGERR